VTHHAPNAGLVHLGRVATEQRFRVRPSAEPVRDPCTSSRRARA
jgi:hypothetical protein